MNEPPWQIPPLPKTQLMTSAEFWDYAALAALSTLVHEEQDPVDGAQWAAEAADAMLDERNRRLNR